MRQILVDRARARGRTKRGGAVRILPLSATDAVVPDDEFDVLALDEALTDLARFDKRLARVVELRSFGGLSIDEVKRRRVGRAVTPGDAGSGEPEGVPAE